MSKFKIWVAAAVFSTFLVLGAIGAPAACGGKDDDQGDCGNATTPSGLDTAPESVNGSGKTGSVSPDAGVVDDARKGDVPSQKDPDIGSATNARDEVYKMLYETFSFPESVELNALRTPWHAKERRDERRKKRSFQELTYRTFEPGPKMAPTPDSNPVIRRIRAIPSKYSTPRLGVYDHDANFWAQNAPYRSWETSPVSPDAGVVDDARKQNVPSQKDPEKDSDTGAASNAKTPYETFNFPESNHIPLELNAPRTPWQAKERKEERRKKRSFQELTYRTFESGPKMAPPPDSNPVIRRIRAIPSKGSETPQSSPEDTSTRKFRSFEVPVDRVRWSHHLEFKANAARALIENARKQAAERKHKDELKNEQQSQPKPHPKPQPPHSRRPILSSRIKYRYPP